IERSDIKRTIWRASFFCRECTDASLVVALEKRRRCAILHEATITGRANVLGRGMRLPYHFWEGYEWTDCPGNNCDISIHELVPGHYECIGARRMDNRGRSDVLYHFPFFCRVHQIAQRGHRRLYCGRNCYLWRRSHCEIAASDWRRDPS